MSSFTIRELVRWVLVAAAVAGALYAGLLISLFALFFGPFPKDLAEPTAGFVTVTLAALAGSFAAPRFHVATAVVLSLAVSGFALLGLMFPLRLPGIAGCVAGGVMSVAWVAWRRRPIRTPRMTRLVRGLVGFAVVGALSLVAARYVDWPASADPLPAELQEALGERASRIGAFYNYELGGGFLDREWLWRLDASPEVVALVVNGLSLHPAPTIPDQLWRMPPHYWPRAPVAGAQAFQSEAFTADGRGRDGLHYFLLHDPNTGRAFIWFKNNF